jgi:ABC-type multidrug transport system fused ATPase/permease subunit
MKNAMIIIILIKIYIMKKRNKKENEGVFSTDFSEKIELTDEERKLRQNYIKNVTLKEAIICSIFLVKKQLLFKIINFIIGVINNVLKIKETKYKSDVVNAITSKDLDKFIFSVKYHIICTIVITVLEFVDNSLFKHLTQGSSSENIMLKNLLYKKDMEFFDLFKTGELNHKVQLYNQYPLFNFLETCLTITEYIFKILYYSYNLYKDFYEMSRIYIISMILQGVIEPYVLGGHNIFELRDHYINEVLSNIRLVKMFGSEKKEINRIEKIEEKLKKKHFFGSL